MSRGYNWDTNIYLVLTILQTDLSSTSERVRGALLLQKSKNITIEVSKCNLLLLKGKKL